jgi:predicted ATPase
MITKWKLFNFKSVRQETELDFGPLTILAGANSSGKSTLIQSMLLISQTVSSKVPSQSVVLNGSLVKLGQFDDIKTQSSDSDQISIGWVCEKLTDGLDAQLGSTFDPDRMSFFADYGMLREVNARISFDTKGEEQRTELAQLHPKLFATEINSLIRDEDGTERRMSLTVSRRQKGFSDKDLTEEELDLSQLRFEVSIDDRSFNEVRHRFSSAIPIGSTVQHFFPDILTIKYNVANERARQFYNALVQRSVRPGTARSARLSEVIVPGSALNILRQYLRDEANLLNKALGLQADLFGELQSVPLPILLEKLDNLTFQEKRLIRARLDDESFFKDIVKAFLSSQSEQFKIARVRFPDAVRDSVNYIRASFSKGMKYLGPLRDEPKSLYPLSAATDPKDVGLKGEYTAAVLNLYQDALISYIPTSAFAKPQIDRRPTTRKLQTAVIDWLTYFGVANDVNTKDLGKLGHELKITPDSTMKPIDLTHVGVGVSQVLPILVSCILAEPDTTLIFEQPELHLHPKVQTLLGDFFLSMALLKKQCILETHSEYLINRLRYRAAAAEGSDNLARIIKMYFVERTEGASKFRDVIVNNYGAILDWPEGFFDQSQREVEEIIRFGMLKKQKERKDDKSNG